MISFAVTHEGLPKDIALWVLAIDEASNQFLLCGEQGFYWRSIDTCTMARLWTPDNAMAVMDVSDVQRKAAGIVLPDGIKGF